MQSDPPSLLVDQGIGLLPQAETYFEPCRINRQGFFYVHDERYAAGARMRRSGAYQIGTAQKYAAGARMRRSGASQIGTALTVRRGRKDAQERRVSGYQSPQRYAAGARMRRSGASQIGTALTVRRGRRDAQERRVSGYQTPNGTPRAQGCLNPYPYQILTRSSGARYKASVSATSNNA